MSYLDFSCATLLDVVVEQFGYSHEKITKCVFQKKRSIREGEKGESTVFLACVIDPLHITI